MNKLLALLVLLAAVAIGLTPVAQSYRFGGNERVYTRISASVTLTGGEDYVELDTDAGALTVTMPASPVNLSRHEIWLGSQPGGTATIDTNGQPSYGAGLTLSSANEGRLLLFVRPQPSGGGYWRVTEL